MPSSQAMHLTHLYVIHYVHACAYVIMHELEVTYTSLRANTLVAKDMIQLALHTYPTLASLGRL